MLVCLVPVTTGIRFLFGLFVMIDGVYKVLEDRTRKYHDKKRFKSTDIL